VCDLETSRIGAPYIYDISNLRVKHIDMMRNYKTAKQDTGHEEKRTFGRLRRRWKNNINMVLKKIVMILRREKSGRLL
jgi:hypothetical protein